MIEFDKLPDADKDNIIHTATAFMQAVTDGYGPDDGYNLWLKVVELFGSDLRDTIFLNMMKNSSSGTVSIPRTYTKTGTNSKYIDYIKIVRHYSGMGLKEAKDFCDKTESGSVTKIEIHHKDKYKFISALRDIGITI